MIRLRRKRGREHRDKFLMYVGCSLSQKNASVLKDD
jgi:hypothetical protein